MGYLLFTEKVTDLNGLVAIGDTSVDGKMGIYEPHLVTVTLGDTGDEILDMAESCTDGSGGLPRTEPSFDLELALASFLVSDEVKVQVEMLEVTDQLSAWAFHLNDLGVHLDLDTVWDVHRLGRQDGLHLRSLCFTEAALTNKKTNRWWQPNPN